MKTIRIFISSPGDVQVERQIAGKVVERLQGKYWSFVRLEDVFWEEKVIRSTGHYQDELIHPGNCEIVVGVLWSRLGSPLPEKFRLQAGSATTGTEWEIEMAFSAYEERLSQLLAEGLPETKARQMAKPDIVIYRRSSERERHSDPEQEAEAQDQQQKLEHYLKQHFKNADHDSTIKRPITGYSALDEFETKLTRNLEELILRTIPDLKPGFEPPPISGSPFKGLRAFGFDDSDRFFGRNRQIREIQDLLQRRAERACPFVLIYGASGYGKSSLMRAGLAPVLTRPGGAGEGKDLWRRVLMQPAVGEGSLTERLVRLLAASPSLEEVVLHKENGTYALSGLSEWQSKFKQAEVSEPQVRWDVSLLTRVLESEELREQGVCLIRICLEEMTTHLLVQVDQLEEVFTTSGMTDPERETFFAVLAALMETGRVWVVATMRSEFFPRIAESPELRRLVGKDGGYILPPPDRQALREIIRYPALAARLGYQRRTGPVIIGKEPARYEDLDDEILADAESSPDALPLLEFCLQELYESILDPQDPKQQRRLSELLRWQDYAKLGGLKGAIAQRADGLFVNLADEVKQAAPMVFASLVRVETGKATVVRQRASLEPLKQSHAFAGSLLEAMQAAHLLISDEEAGHTMVTLAHEALLSHWGRLSTWVADHRGDLLARQRLHEQAELWESHGRQKSYLLAEARLAEAERVMQVGLFQLEPEVEALIHQSQQRSQKQVWALRVAVAFFALVAAAAVFLGWRTNVQKQIAVQLGDAATQSAKLAKSRLYVANINTAISSWQAADLMAARAALWKTAPEDRSWEYGALAALAGPAPLRLGSANLDLLEHPLLKTTDAKEKVSLLLQMKGADVYEEGVFNEKALAIEHSLGYDCFERKGHTSIVRSRDGAIAAMWHSLNQRGGDILSVFRTDTREILTEIQNAQWGGMYAALFSEDQSVLYVLANSIRGTFGTDSMSVGEDETMDQFVFVVHVPNRYSLQGDVELWDFDSISREGVVFESQGDSPSRIFIPANVGKSAEQTTNNDFADPRVGKIVDRNGPRDIFEVHWEVLESANDSKERLLEIDSKTGVATLWDLDQSVEIQRFSNGLMNEVQGIISEMHAFGGALSADGKLALVSGVVSASDPSKIAACIFNVSDGRLVSELKGDKMGPFEYGSTGGASRWRFSPDSSLVFQQTHDFQNDINSLAVCDVRSGEMLPSLSGIYTDASWDPSGEYFFKVSASDHLVEVHQRSEGWRIVNSFKTFEGRYMKIELVQRWPEVLDRLFAYGSVFAWPEMNEVLRFPDWVAVSPDGKTLAILDSSPEGGARLSHSETEPSAEDSPITGPSILIERLGIPAFLTTSDPSELSTAEKIFVIQSDDARYRPRGW